MANSFSRPDPTSAASVSSAQFNTARRGFDQNEVRDFLRMVAAELARLQERERHLEREVKAAQAQPKSSITSIDEQAATRLLGEEAAHILAAAREAAAQIRTKAEEGAARLLRESTDEAHRLRSDAEIEVARKRQDATNDAEAEVNVAKQQGREMVNEARAYRERVLTELARRRETARQQIEQLVHGRDRLMQAFERSRQAAVDVMAELGPLGEPEEYVNLSLVTGPIPIMLPADQTGPIPRSAPISVPTPVAGPEPVVEAVAPAEKPTPPPDEPYPDDNDDPDFDEHEPVNELSELSEVSEEVDVVAASPVAVANAVDDLFAKLRAARTDLVHADVTVDQTVAAAGPDLAVEPVVDVLDEPVVESDAQRVLVNDAASEAMTPLIVAAARKLKRVLADEQNDVLDTLRRKDPVRTLDALLPAEADHNARYIDAVCADLTEAGLAGAAGDPNGGDVAIVRPACDAITEAIVNPLRGRIVRCIDRADGNNAELAMSVRSVYREWKLNRIDEHLDEIVRLAFERGALTLASR